MTRFRYLVLTALAAVLALLGGAALTGAPAQAQLLPLKAASKTAAKTAPLFSEPGPDLNDGKPLPLSPHARAHAQRLNRSLRTVQSLVAPSVGSVKSWVVADDFNGTLDVADFTLRGLGNHVQVWVANDNAFPTGDCRNDLPAATDVTDAQVTSFVHEFDTNIYPKEASAFSVAPNRDGTNGAEFAQEIGEPDDYYQVPAAQADDITVLVSNIRDANYYEPSTPDGQTYEIGYFSSYFNDLTDRNIMNIDSFNWEHVTGANPPDDSADPAWAACAAALGRAGLGSAQPDAIEGTFAHEYQHLLESYADPDETTWVNEGLSEYAQLLTGYDHTNIAVDQPGTPYEYNFFTGFGDPSFGGPENSLTLWGDQGGPEILADYGAAYSFMTYVAGRFGNATMSALHKNPANGLVGLDAVLKAKKTNVTAQQAIHDWSAEMALDAVTKNNVIASAPSRFKSALMTSKINWDNPQAYDSPGAPPNGSDYVRLRKANGQYLATKDLKKMTFDGAKTLPPLELEWTSESNPPDDTSAMTCGDVGAGVGPAALYSGCDDNLDRSIVRQATVPATGATFSFDALWNTEEGYDYAYPIVSGDGGKTWTELTTEDTSPEGGFTGDGETWKHETADLAGYAGKTVQIGFRYVTDAGVSNPGIWVRNLKVGTTSLPTDLTGWKTITQVRPVQVGGYTVQLLSYDAKGNSWWTKMPLNAAFHGTMTGPVRGALGSGTTVAAIVTYDDPSESSTQEAPYALTVNGVLQPGG